MVVLPWLAGRVVRRMAPVFHCNSAGHHYRYGMQQQLFLPQRINACLRLRWSYCEPWCPTLHRGGVLPPSPSTAAGEGNRYSVMFPLSLSSSAVCASLSRRPSALCLSLSPPARVRPHLAVHVVCTRFCLRLHSSGFPPLHQSLDIPRDSHRKSLCTSPSPA